MRCLASEPPTWLCALTALSDSVGSRRAALHVISLGTSDTPHVTVLASSAEATSDLPRKITLHPSTLHPGLRPHHVKDARRTCGTGGCALPLTIMVKPSSH
jgi:hypothetical protein